MCVSIFFVPADFQGSESVVFSQAVGDHVVTVTTQPAEGEPDQLGLQPPEILGVEGTLYQGFTLQSLNYDDAKLHRFVAPGHN